MNAACEVVDFSVDITIYFELNLNEVKYCMC